MTIVPLSDATSRLLGSTVVLNDSTSVVKELIDNALDSNASSVLVEISSNTVDVVQVKDNGAGIGVEDRQLLCRRGYTSKIRTIEDLEKLGGTYLGFRGEALASITNISESVSITTRVEGELVGTTLKYGPQATLQSSASASHSVGTTVRVQNFLATIPVRKQTVLKSSTRILADVKKLLLNYAFARPTVRFALKVLKAKNEKGNWSYVPCSSGNQLFAAAAKIVGTDLAGSCEQLSKDLSDSTHGESQTYKCQALLLKADHITVMGSGNRGQYVSLDRRPVTIDRGIFKEILKLYKSHLRHAATAQGNSISSPFLCLHVECPEGSYDVNVEPSKGEVLFHRPDMIMNLVSSLFVQQYGSLPEGSEVSSRSEPVSRKSKPQPFEVLLARKSVPNPISHVSEGTDAIDNSVSVEPLSGMTMFHEAIPQRQSDSITSPAINADLDEIESSVDTIQNKNPFLIARVNTLSRPNPSQTTTSASSDVHSNKPSFHSAFVAPSPTSPASATESVTPIMDRIGSSLDSPYLPTPDKTPFQNPGPPLRRKPPHSSDDVSDFHFADAETCNRQLSNLHNQPAWRTNDKSHDLQAPVIRSAKDMIADDAIEEAASSDSNIAAAHGHAHQHMGPPQRQTRSGGTYNTLSKPFRSPIKDDLTSTRINSFTRGAAERIRHANQDRARLHPRTNPELEEIMDFEYRKQALNSKKNCAQSKLDPTDLSRLQRDSMGDQRPQETAVRDSQASDYATKFGVTQGPSGLASNTHRNRYLAAKASLSAGLEEAPQQLGATSVPTPNPATSSSNLKTILAKSVIPATDPRAYLIATNRAVESGQPVKRIKPSRLPLETVPPGAANHSIMAVPDRPFPGFAALAKMVQELSAVDPYVKSGKVHAPSFNPFSSSIDIWQSTLENLISTQFYAEINTTEGETERIPARLEVALSRAIKAHLTALEPENA